MPNKTISIPAGYAPAFAIGFSDDSGALAIVNGTQPLPVQAVSASVPSPLVGTASTSGSVGPFTPVPDRPVMLTLSGTWTGTIWLERSVNGGTTRVRLTVGGRPWGSYTANACEPAWFENETGASLFLAVTLTSGAVSYRLAQ